MSWIKNMHFGSPSDTLGPWGEAKLSYMYWNQEQTCHKMLLIEVLKVNNMHSGSSSDPWGPGKSKLSYLHQKSLQCFITFSQAVVCISRMYSRSGHFLIISKYENIVEYDMKIFEIRWKNIRMWTQLKNNPNWMKLFFFSVFMIWQVLANQISYSRYCLVSLLFVSGEPSRNLRINLHDCGHSLGTVCGRSLPDWLQPRYFYRFTRYVLFPVEDWTYCKPGSLTQGSITKVWGRKNETHSKIVRW